MTLPGRDTLFAWFEFEGKESFRSGPAFGHGLRKHVPHKR